jgi:aminopeptidase YwaD
MKKGFISIVCILLGFAVVAQEGNDWDKKEYAKEIVKTLASEEMHGRGYVNGGDGLAAGYIEKMFRLNHLKNFTRNYEQPFHFPVNTFPGKIAFRLNGKDKHTKKEIALVSKPGIDMLVGAGNPSIKGEYEAVVFDSTYTVSEQAFEKFRKKIKSVSTFIIVDDRQVSDKTKLEYFKKVKANYFNTVGVIDFSKKLTHTISQRVENYTEIKLLTDSFNLDFTSLKKCKVVLEIENQFIPSYVTQNVIGFIEGSHYPDSFIVFSAHYDHLGRMGKEVLFPGANDNASGCSMLLNLVRYYSIPANKPKYSIVFMAFAGEETGLMGSSYFVAHPLFPLSKIRFLLNMDIMGTGDEGITVVNGTVFKNEFDKLVEINKENDLLKEVKVRGKAANSDHYPFSEKGVKAFFIYSMGGIKAYHDVYDKSETLPLTKFEALFTLILQFTDYLQQGPEAALNH